MGVLGHFRALGFRVLGFRVGFWGFGGCLGGFGVLGECFGF